jgi:hypothetical protein
MVMHHLNAVVANTANLTKRGSSPSSTFADPAAILQRGCDTLKSLLLQKLYGAVMRSGEVSLSTAVMAGVSSAALSLHRETACLFLLPFYNHWAKLASRCCERNFSKGAH